MKTDEALKRDVEAELAWDPAVNSSAVGVVVNDGVVTLTGHLDSYAQKWAVEKALRRLAGVKAIAMELDVRVAPDHVRSDTEIAQAAETALKWHTMVPTDAIRLRVDKGWVTIDGQVDWDFERRAVEATLRHLKGVVGITNDIQLKQTPTPATLAELIEAALSRQATRQAERMTIITDADGTVTLRGTVHSWYERGAAVGAAWAAPGVRNVVNELKIG